MKDKDGLMIENEKLVGYKGKLPSYLVVPDGVKEIGLRAFSGCLGIETIAIPDSVKWIERFAFEECVNLYSVSLPANGIQLHADAFEKCLSLKKLDIPQGTNVIGKFNFYAHFHRNDVVDVPDFVSVIETRGWTGGGICDGNREYMAFNVRVPFYDCDAVRFYDHVEWNIDLYSSFQQCNKLLLCSHETKTDMTQSVGEDRVHTNISQRLQK